MQYPLERTLDFSNNNIDDERLSKILSNITNITTIVRINLSFNQLTINGARELVRFIKNIPQLDYLDLTCNKLNDEAISLFSELNIREIHFESNPMTGVTLNSYATNTHILILAYQRELGNEVCDAITQELESHLEYNRQQFRARMVFSFLTIAQACRQPANIFSRLPLPVVAHILRSVGADFHYANTALSNPLLAINDCIEYIIDMIAKKGLQKKLLSESKDFSFFKAISGLVPIGGRFIEKNETKEEKKRCLIL